MTETAARGQTTYPAAELDRRFYAFLVDRLIAWGLYAGAGYLAYRQFFDDDRTWAGVGTVAALVLVVGVGFAVLLGVAGVSPGKAVAGLRVVDNEAGTPIGVGRALLRTLILGIAALPTFCLGVATLAWTAVMDPGGWRRGWHDHASRAVVVDIRPVPVHQEVEESRPRQIVNLTAMRLMPSPPEPPDPPDPPD
ncbi:MAG: RDD family protein, partial [Actinomycetota bacterium]|nr:RDD family protein [Actinomycetota bacterium]